MLALGSIGMMLHTSPQLLGLALVALPPLAGTAVYLGRRMKRRQERVQQKLADATSLATEVFANMRIVREFASEQTEATRYAQRVDAVKKDGIKVGLLQSLMDSAVFFGANIGLIAVMSYGSQLVTDGTITAGDLTSFLMYRLVWLALVYRDSGFFFDVCKQGLPIKTPSLLHSFHSFTPFPPFPPSLLNPFPPFTPFLPFPPSLLHSFTHSHTPPLPPCLCAACIWVCMRARSPTSVQT